VLPLAIASGAGSASQRAIGTGVIGGMITAPAGGVLRAGVLRRGARFFKGSARQQQRYAEHAAQAGISSEAARHAVDEAEAGMTPEQRRAGRPVAVGPRTGSEGPS
jgi:multidrug efflux pump